MQGSEDTLKDEGALIYDRCISKKKWCNCLVVEIWNQLHTQRFEIWNVLDESQQQEQLQLIDIRIGKQFVVKNVNKG